MLVGRHGIGKSQIIAEHFQNRGLTVIAFFLGQMSDPGDLIGLLHKEESTGRSEFLPPYWWPSDDKPIVLFLDELNRARPEILQSVMELALNKTLAGKQLPAGSLIISAVNEGDEYQLTDLDPALVSRFNLYEFAPTIEDWLLWAEKNDIDERVTAFIQKQPHFLDGHGVNESVRRSSLGTGQDTGSPRVGTRFGAARERSIHRRAAPQDDRGCRWLQGSDSISQEPRNTAARVSRRRAHGLCQTACQTQQECHSASCCC